VPSSTNTSEPIARVLSRVQGAKPKGRGWVARCPAHNDRTPSLSIDQGDDGRALLHCHAGCTHDAIAAALGIERRELFADARESVAPQPRAPRLFATAKEGVEAYRATLGQESARWIYRDAAGQPVGIVLRWNLADGGKTIRPLWRIGENWRQTYPPQRSIYALDRLLNDRDNRVYVTEGEKCAEMIAALGLLATTSAGGANGAERATWEPLAGREVVILPDADEAGTKYADAVRARLAALNPPARVAVVALPGLEDGEDAVEFVGRVHSGSIETARQAIEELARNALASAPRKRIALGELLADPKLRHKPETIESGWEPFDQAQPFEAIERGAKVVLSAPPGCYKTATMLRMARGFAEQGHRVAWLAAEMQPRALVRRMLCQAAGLGQAALLSEAMPPDHARRFAEASKRLAALKNRIEFTIAPIGFEELDRAAEGADVVFVDYLQLLRHPEASARGHERLEDAMARISEAAQRTGAAFILAAAQGRDGGGETRELHNAVRGSSSIEFTVDAMYCARAPSKEERESPAGFTIEFRCLKQREGTQMKIEVVVDGRTGAIADEAHP
jgi:hypothetical protein